MIRYLDKFIHYLWLWLIPLLVFPAGITLVLMSSTTYTAKATLWVDQPIFSAQQNVMNQYDSPAKQMGSLLTELLNTREFVNSVIGSTSRKQAIKSSQDQSNAIDYILTKTKIAGDNTRLITISFPDSKAVYAVETLQAIIDRFQDYYNGRMKNQGEGAQVYYQEILNAAKTDLDKATDEVKKFIEDHPNQLGTNNQVASNAGELEYNRLNQNLDNARKSYDTAKANLDSVASNYAAYLQGQATTIRVLDKPAISEVGGTQLRQAAIGIGAGAVLALIVSIIGTIILTLLDPNLRYGFYARQVLGREYIVELPNYGLSKKAKKQKNNAGKYNLESFVKNNNMLPAGKKLLGRKAHTSVVLRKMLSNRIRLSPEE